MSFEAARAPVYTLLINTLGAVLGNERKYFDEEIFSEAIIILGGRSGVAKAFPILGSNLSDKLTFGDGKGSSYGEL